MSPPATSSLYTTLNIHSHRILSWKTFTVTFVESKIGAFFFFLTICLDSITLHYVVAVLKFSNFRIMRPLIFCDG